MDTPMAVSERMRLPLTLSYQAACCLTSEATRSEG